MPQIYSKRSFLKASLAGTLGLGTLAKPILAGPAEKFYIPEVPAGYTFLFQGDSITDANRVRTDLPNVMGQGYAHAVASRIGADFPEAGFTFYNRGISGDKVYNLENRWEEETLALQPDVLSILAGINDVGDLIHDPDYPAMKPGFETSYRNILRTSREQNPSLLIILGLPFIYPTGKRAEKKELWVTYTEEKQAFIRQLAKEFDALLIDYPALFAWVEKRKPAEYWVGDGVHPTIFGHELMAREWLRVAATRLDFLRIYL